MDFDSVVIGAGVVGLAIARALAATGRSVLVLEKNRSFGEETSSRNSEVIHAGIYYPTGSLKAQLCLKGKRQLYSYLDDRNINYKVVGKLIVASDDAQIPALRCLYKKGKANGVEGLSMLSKLESQTLEPALSAVRAIRSESTGIVDSYGFMLSLIGDIEALGGIISYQTEVEEIKKVSKGLFVCTDVKSNYGVTAKEVINSGGLHAHTVSHRFKDLGAKHVPAVRYSRGIYFSLRGKNPFHHLIYPLPSSGGLGVHLTIDLGGGARFGPDTEWVKDINYDFDVKRSTQFTTAIAKYYKDIRAADLAPAYAGIRPKVSYQGGPFGDFLIHGEKIHGKHGYIALYGIESPGLTSSLAVGDYVVNLLAKPA